MGLTGLMAVILPAYLAALSGVDLPAREVAIDSLVLSRQVDAIAEAVYDSGWWTREGLITALGRMGSDAAPLLIDIATQHPKVDAQRLAIIGLGRVGGETAREGLLAMISGPHRDLVAQALGTLGDVVAVPYLRTLLCDSLAETRRRAALALVALEGVGALDVLMPLLSDDHYSVRFAVADALGDLGGPAESALIKNYDALSVMGRFQVLRILGRLGDDQGVAMLLVALSDDHWLLRAAAAENMGLSKRLDLYTQLQNALHQEHHPVVRLRIVAAMGLLSQ